jgi:hypothetical protein
MHTTLHSKSFKPTPLLGATQVLRDLFAATPLAIFIHALKSGRTEQSGRSATHRR